MAAGGLSGGVAGGKLRKPVSSLYMPIQQSGGCLFKPVYAYTTGWGMPISSLYQPISQDGGTPVSSLYMICHAKLTFSQHQTLFRL